MYISQLLHEAVKHRYLHIDVDVNQGDTSKERVVDNFIPLALSGISGSGISDAYHGINDDTINRAIRMDNSIVISELNHMITGGVVKLKTVPDIVYNVLGYTQEQVKESLEAIKSKNIDLILVGYGGFNINAVHIWAKLIEDLNVEPIFTSLNVYENDLLKFSNTLRIMKDTTSIQCAVGQNIPKVLLGLKDFARLAGDNAQYHIEYLTREKSIELAISVPNPVFYGAPDFTTRDVLKDCPFIFAGHSGDNSILYSRPVVDGSITTETYGNINLNTFFINVIKASVESLMILAKDTPLESDTLLLQYSCTNDKAVTDKLNLGQGVQNG